MNPRYELDAFLQEAGKRVPFRLRIWPAEKSKGEEDYFCRVHAPELFSSDKDIFGANAEQAYQLAQEFVKSMLKDKMLVDEKGRPVELFRH